MSYYFVEPDQLNLAVSIAQWSEEPWFRGVTVYCDGCGREAPLILVSQVIIADDVRCGELLDKELVRRGWRLSEHPRGPDRSEFCPECQRG